jgi:hypothetical protein
MLDAVVITFSRRREKLYDRDPPLTTRSTSQIFFEQIFFFFKFPASFLYHFSLRVFLEIKKKRKTKKTTFSFLIDAPIIITSRKKEKKY